MDFIDEIIFSSMNKIIVDGIMIWLAIGKMFRLNCNKNKINSSDLDGNLCNLQRTRNVVSVGSAWVLMANLHFRVNIHVSSIDSSSTPQSCVDISIIRVVGIICKFLPEYEDVPHPAWNPEAIFCSRELLSTLLP